MATDRKVLQLPQAAATPSMELLALRECNGHLNRLVEMQREALALLRTMVGARPMTDEEMRWLARARAETASSG